jgi:hypothetical protein
MSAILILYSLWGAVGLFFGLALLGVGSVPLAFLALLFRGKFEISILMVLGTALVFGGRFLGIRLASNAPTRSSQ